LKKISQDKESITKEVEVLEENLNEKKKNTTIMSNSVNKLQRKVVVKERELESVEKEKNEMESKEKKTS